MKETLKHLYPIVILILLFATSAWSQMEVFVGETSQWLFGMNEDLGVLWKLPNKGYSIACSDHKYFFAINNSTDPVKAYSAHIPDGKIAWSTSITGVPTSWEISPDSIYGSQLTLTLDIGDSLRYETRDFSTGYLRYVKTNVKSVQSKERGSCPLPRPGDTLRCFSTSKFICSISPQISVIWQQKLMRNEHLASSNRDYIVLNGDKHIRVLNIITGSQVWEKLYKTDITGVGLSRNILTISFSNGSKDSLDMQNGISKQKRY